MILRYFVLFAGVVLMITGCNNLISQNFGTHNLRTVALEEVIAEGLGDADYVEITGGELGNALLVGPALRVTDKDYILRPILTRQQAANWYSGATVRASVIGWFKNNDPDCVTAEGCPPDKSLPIKGLIGPPTDKKNPVELWSTQRIKLEDQVTYIQLYEEPMAWYWNLIMFLGGLLVAIVPEAWRFQKRKTADNNKPSAT
ncbi:hypothetical protein [Lewinella sp. W8]|uniref:hypothetical protein n=1 Tax=Lewinella sp. W8 TaxID=2528208 RepID=UPI00106829F3|nr:hypothetical protein [Lewinella sp. W8]MTB51074.1 hypothetical protein [Lewinella sp. W8]